MSLYYLSLLQTAFASLVLWDKHFSQQFGNIHSNVCGTFVFLLQKLYVIAINLYMSVAPHLLGPSLLLTAKIIKVNTTQMDRKIIGNCLPFASGTFLRAAATTLIIMSFTETLTSYCSAIKDQIKIILDYRCTRTKCVTSKMCQWKINISHTFKILSKGKKRIQCNIWHIPIKIYIN